MEESRTAWRLTVQTPTLVNVPALRGIEGWAWPTLCLANAVRGRAQAKWFVQFALDPGALLPLARCQTSSAKPLKGSFWGRFLRSRA